MTRSSAGCQSAPADATSENEMTWLKTPSAACTSADVQSVVPFHKPLYLSTPSSPRSTFSSRCFCVHAGPIEIAVLPAALIFAAWTRNSLQLFGGAPRFRSVTVFGMYHNRLDRWMLTGTE